MLYLHENPDNLSTKDLYTAIESLPPYRKEKAMQYKFDIDRKLCVLAYQLLKKGLLEQYGFKDDLKWGYGADNKPYLLNYPHIHFNISHCKKAVACIIGSSELGIDVEEILPFDAELAQQVCNKEEYNKIINSDNKEQEFAILWTKKESLLKLQGRGLVNDLKNILESTESYNFHTTINMEVGYVLTWVCISHR